MQSRLEKINQMLQDHTNANSNIYIQLNLLIELLEKELQEQLLNNKKIKFHHARNRILNNLKKIIKDLHDDGNNIISNIHLYKQFTNDSVLKQALQREENRRKRLAEQCKERFVELSMQYKLLLEADLSSAQVELVKEESTFDYPALDQSIKKVSDSVNEIYESLNTSYFQNYNHHSKKLTDNINAFQRDVISFKDKVMLFETNRLTLFSEKYVYSKSYKNDTRHLNGVLNKIKATFNEYTHGRWKFHWFRSHSKEAIEVAKKMDALSLKKENVSLKEAEKYIIGVLKRLEMNNKLNLKGSFSRRAHFCLKLIKEKSEEERKAGPAPFK